MLPPFECPDCGFVACICDAPVSQQVPSLGELVYSLVSLIDCKPVPGHPGMTQRAPDWDDLPYELRETWEERAAILAVAIRHSS
jgi:hypothetical protein